MHFQAQRLKPNDHCRLGNYERWGKVGKNQRSSQVITDHHRSEERDAGTLIFELHGIRDQGAAGLCSCQCSSRATRCWYTCNGTGSDWKLERKQFLNGSWPTLSPCHWWKKQQTVTMFWWWQRHCPSLVLSKTLTRSKLSEIFSYSSNRYFSIDFDTFKSLVPVVRPRTVPKNHAGDGLTMAPLR